MKASGISGRRMAFDFLLDDVDFPRLLELGFFDFVWAEDLPVVCVVDDFAVVSVVEESDVESSASDFAVVCVVDLRLFEDLPGAGGGSVVVVDGGCVELVEDDDVYLSVTSMVR